MRSDIICLKYTHFYKYVRSSMIIEHIVVYIHITFIINFGHIPEEKIIRMAMNHQIRPH